MIGFIQGTIRKKFDHDLLIQAGAVGYRVFVPQRDYDMLHEGDAVELYTSLVVREDALTLYGFVSDGELELFDTLTSVSGIGPKSGLAILSGADPEALRHAIAFGDTAYLSKFSGIGKKSAEKIVLELKDRFLALSNHDSSYAGGPEREALEALEALGYSIREVRDIVRMFSKDSADPKTIISKTLQQIGKR